MIVTTAMSNRMKKGAVWMPLAFLIALSSLSALAQSAPPSGVEAASTPLGRPHEVAYDTAGNVYIADTDENVIRKVNTSGVITTVAGDGEQGYGGDGGLATAALLDSPAGVAVDASGNIYIADTHNNCVREVWENNGNITTIAGTGAAGFSGDGAAATLATLNYPTAVAVDSHGNVYIADTNNHRIREITGTTINTVAGDGEQFFSGDGSAAIVAGLDSPNGVAVDAAFNIYIGDTHNQRVRMVTHSSGEISTLAGTGENGFTGDGPVASTALARPRGVAVDASGDVYLADSDNNRIRSIRSGSVTTIAGDGVEGFSGDGGSPTGAWLDMPDAVAVWGSTVLFSDTENNRVRLVSDGEINTIAGIADVPAALISPTSGTVLTGNTQTFTWSAGIGASGYVLLLGSTGAGSNNLLDAHTTATTVTANNLPANGALIYARLITNFNGVLAYNDYTFTTASPAALTSPTPGTAFTGPSVTFTWAPVSGASGYVLLLGSTGVGSNNLLDAHTTAATVTANNLPANGEPIYARLMTNFNGVWVYNDYTYTAISPAWLTSPAANATLAGSGQSFTWSPVAGVSGYVLLLGSAGAGSNDLFDGHTTGTTLTTGNLPVNGETIYARLITNYNGGAYAYTDSTFTAVSPAWLTSPAANATLAGSSQIFTWNPAGGATSYTLCLGSTGVGSCNLFDGHTTGATLTVNNLPVNGETIYARLITDFNGVYAYTDSTLTAK